MCDLREHWRTCGPPAHIALAVIAASLGNTLTGERESVAEKVVSGPTIAEMAAMAPPIGTDTMGASMRILDQLRTQAQGQGAA